MEITVNGLNKQIKATREQIFSICNKCSSSDLYCDEDLNIKYGYMSCDKLVCELERRLK